MYGLRYARSDLFTGYPWLTNSSSARLISTMFQKISADANSGTVLDTANATQTWEEARDWDGRNWISRHTGQQWTHQMLCRSRRGRYYIVHSSDYQGTQDHAEWIANRRAAAWLLLNEDVPPEELEPLVDEVSG